jgi:YD repeat-containing protein
MTWIRGLRCLLSTSFLIQTRRVCEATTSIQGPATEGLRHRVSAASDQSRLRDVGRSGRRTATYLSTGVGAGLIGTLADGEGNLTTYEYDAFRRLARMRYPNASGGGSSTTDEELYAYDDAGNLTQQTRRGGSTITFDYDDLNRLISADPSTADPTITYTYDNFSRSITVSASSQTLTYAYDQLSRVISEAQPRGTMEYEWDLAGRRTRLIFPPGSGDTLTIKYESRPRLRQANDRARCRTTDRTHISRSD